MKLYDHQKAIIDDDPKKCGLFMGTGSGKTRVALMLAQGSVLVICPKTQKEDRNWEREHDTLIEGRSDKWRKATEILAITTITFDIFKRDHETLPRFDTVIVDEAHGMLGVTPNTRQRKRVEIPKASQRFEALEEYLERTKPTRLYLCTATIIKSPFTVWAANKLLRPDRVWNFYDFRQRFYVKLPMPGRDVYAVKKDSDTKDNLAAMVQSLGYVGRLSDYFDVPEQTFKDEYVELTTGQKERLKEIRLMYPDPIVQLGKRLQIENGVLAGDEFSMGETFDNAKLDKILDYVVEFPRMIVFARYLAQIEQLRVALEKTGKKVFVMTGGVKDRGELIASVNASDDYVFLVSAQISAGWEVPACEVMVFASRTYSFVDYDQALGRILRANALKKNLYINLIVRGGVDEAVHKSLENKQDFSERVYLNV